MKKLNRAAIVMTLFMLCTPAAALACPICFGGDPNSPEAQSLNWAIFTLLGVTGGVLSGFVGFIFHLMKLSRQSLGNEPHPVDTDNVAPRGRS